jgi:hypothetical protein
MWVGQFVECGRDLIFDDFELHGHNDLHEYVVLGFRITADLQMLDLQVDFGSECLNRPNEASAAGGNHATEFAAILDDASLRLIDAHT